MSQTHFMTFLFRLANLRLLEFEFDFDFSLLCHFLNWSVFSDDDDDDDDYRGKQTPIPIVDSKKHKKQTKINWFSYYSVKFSMTILNASTCTGMGILKSIAQMPEGDS